MNDDVVLEIDSILMSNRNILRRNYLVGMRMISKMELISAGYAFSYHTSEIKNQDDERVFNFVYDFGLSKIADEFYEIIKLPIQ